MLATLDLADKASVQAKADQEVGKEFETLPGLRDRLSSAVWGSYSIRSEPTQTMKDQRRVVAEQLSDVENRLAALLTQSEAW
jgi:hypothetical protein